MKKKKRLRKVGIALLVVCGLAAFANSFSDHNKTPANNTPSIASYSLSVDDSAAAPAFADVYASAGQTACPKRRWRRNRTPSAMASSRKNETQNPAGQPTAA